MSGWRVQAVQDDSTFMRDQIKLFMAYQDSEGFRAVIPIVLELSAHPLPAHTAIPVEPTVIPRELAEKLYSELGYMLTGVVEPLNEIMRLRRDLNDTKKMLADLISGIGKLGGKNAD